MNLSKQGPFVDVFDGKRRTMFRNYDGNIVLADECKCAIEWLGRKAGTFAHEEPAISFRIIRSIDCPIDEHKSVALQTEAA